MRKIFFKYYFIIIYFLFVISFLLVVFIRDSIDNQLVINTINYFFWYSFGLSSGIFLSHLISRNNKE